MTSYKGELNRLKEKILSNLDLKILKINFWEGKTELVPEIALLEDLEEIHIAKNNRIKDYPTETADLTKLRTIRHYQCNLKKIPKVWGQIESLESLVLSHNSFNKSTNWSVLSTAKKLRKLDLSYAIQSFRCFPESLCGIASLESLNITGNQISQLPASFAQLKKLRCLNAAGNIFEAFPLILCQLPQLQQLILPVHTLQYFNNQALGILQINDLRFTGQVKSPLVHDLKSLILSLRKGTFSEQEASLFLQIIHQKVDINSLHNADLVTVLNCGVLSCVNLALLTIEKRINQGIFGENKLPSAGDKIVFVGRTTGKSSDLKRLFWDNDIRTGVKINTSTQFILLSKNPGLSYQKMLQNKWNILTEQMAIRYLNHQKKPFLLQEIEAGKKDNLNKISSLLLSMQEDNIYLGLELLKTGGLPKEITTSLFLAYKVCSTQKIKRAIFDFLSQIAPLEFTTALKHRKKIGANVSEKTLRNNLEYYSALCNLNAFLMAQFLMEKYQKGILYALFNLKKSAQITYFSSRIKEGKLDLSSLDLKDLPLNFSAIEGLLHLDLSGNKLSLIPEVLSECNELISLDLRGNKNLHLHEKGLLACSNLTTIYLDISQKEALGRKKTFHKKSICIVVG